MTGDRGRARIRVWRLKFEVGSLELGSSDQGLLAGPPRYKLVPRTLAFVTHQGAVLLLQGAPTKRLWAGKFNGVGGHVERGEDVLTSARREIWEETGLAVTELRLCGAVNVDVGAEAGIGVFVFRAEAFTRQTRPSSEGELHWVEPHQMAELPLVPDLPIILPRALAHRPGDEPFFARYSYDDQDQLVITFG